MAEALLQKVYEDIQTLKTEVHFIKQHLVDADTLMTPDEEAHFEESMKELKEGRTTSLADLKKELGL